MGKFYNRIKISNIKIINIDGNIKLNFELDEKGKIKPESKKYNQEFYKNNKLFVQDLLISKKNNLKNEENFTNFDTNYILNEEDLNFNENLFKDIDLQFDFKLDEARGMKIELLPDPF